MIIDTKVYSCRECQSEDLVKNGTNASGSSQYHCKACGTYGVPERTERATGEKKELIINVYQERCSMRGIEWMFGVSRRTLNAWLKEQANDLPLLTVGFDSDCVWALLSAGAGRPYYGGVL